MSALPKEARAMLPALFDEYVEELHERGALRWLTTARELCEVSGRKRWNEKDTARGLGLRYRRLECHDREPYYNVRMVDGWTPKSGSRQRYLQPLRRKPRLYVAPGDSLEDLQDTSRMFYMAEGEKKTLALRQFGYRAVGFSGVYGFHDPEIRKARKVWKLLPDFAEIGLQGSDVRIIVDADFGTNPNVQKAMAQAKGMLLAEGAKSAEVIVSPERPDFPDGKREKSGVDDVIEHLMQGGTL